MLPNGSWAPRLRRCTAALWRCAQRKSRRIGSPLSGAVEQARADERNWRLDEAAERWKSIWANHPDHPLAHAGYADILRKLNRCDEALAVLETAVARFPDLAYLAIDRVATLAQKGEFEKASRLAGDLLLRFPDEPTAHEIAGRSLRGLFRLDEADAVLTRAQASFPNHLGLAIEHASIAEVRGDRSDALRRCEAVLARFPSSPLVHATLGAALKRLRRYDEADAFLVRAMARFPDNSNLGVNYAWSAEERGDWVEALRRWGALQDRFGREPRVRTGLQECQGRADLARIDGLLEQAAAAPPELPRDEPAAGATQHRGLFMSFESLGENCEFGFVQRHYGAEPLGLLRWAGIEFSKLLIGLDRNFEGVGGTDRTVMDLNPNNHEYFTTDTLYGLGMHTFILRDEANEARIYEKMCRRLGYLRDKLLDDLRTGEKIFVFQSGQPTTDDDLRTLLAALRRHGPNRLLAVRPAAPDETAGAMDRIADGLVTATIDKVGYNGRHWSVSFDHWLRFCRAAPALLDTASQSQA